MVWLNLRSVSDPWALLDGRANAPVGGSFQQSDFFTYARQNGQSAYTSRPPWQVAGVDYPVGIPSATVLTNPASGGLPSGASYSAGTHTVTVSGANVTLDGWDFSLNNGVAIDVTAAASGILTIKNCKWVFGSNMTGMSTWLNIDGSSTITSFVFRYNDVDGQAIQGILGTPSSGTQGPDFKNFSDSTVTFEYNRIYNINGRFQYSKGSFVMRFNYFEGQNYNSTAHGEWTLFNAQAGIQTNPLIQCSYNTFLQPAAFGGGMTAPIYASSGRTSPAYTISQVTIDHNTSVVNYFQFTGSIASNVLTVSASNSTVFFGPAVHILLTPGGTEYQISSNGTGTGGTGTYNVTAPNTASQTMYAIECGVGLIAIQDDTVTTADILTNYVDSTGTFTASTPLYSANVAPGTLTKTGNINMKTGGAVT